MDDYDFESTLIAVGICVVTVWCATGLCKSGPFHHSYVEGELMSSTDTDEASSDEADDYLDNEVYNNVGLDIDVDVNADVEVDVDVVEDVKNEDVDVDEDIDVELEQSTL